MPAVTVTVAEEVKDLIEAGSFTETDYVVERTYADWDRDLTTADELALTEADKLRVDVASHTTEQKSELSSRGTLKFDAPIDICIRRKFSQDKQDAATGRINVSELDALVLFVEEIHVYLTKLRMAGATEAVWQTTELLANPVRDHLRELKQFTGIIRLNFRADVSLS